MGKQGPKEKRSIAKEKVVNMRSAFAEGMLNLNMNPCMPIVRIKSAEERSRDA